MLGALFKGRTPLHVALLQRENESVQYGSTALQTWAETSNAACVARTVGRLAGSDSRPVSFQDGLLEAGDFPRASCSGTGHSFHDALP